MRVLTLDVTLYQRPCFMHFPLVSNALTVESLAFRSRDHFKVLADFGNDAAGVIIAVEGVRDGVVDVGEVVHLLTPSYRVM